jgi:D-alanyl-D-alanine carboxypeptidase/D-alanyl-D-alanine-endopeptidase (penicillin-binding protein 4)
MRHNSLRQVAAVLLFLFLSAPDGRSQAKQRPDIAKFRARVEATLANARIDKGYWSVLVEDATTGEILYDLNSRRYFIPASNTKLFTTAFAMATLGPDYRFRTTIETRAAPDESGRLRGDLVLVARGDPNLSNRKWPFGEKVERDGPPEKVLAELADHVAARGIFQIDGDIVVDDSWFVEERYPAGWAIDDMTAGYGAPVSAFSLNDNQLFVEYRAGEREGAPAWFGVEPWADFYTFRNEIVTGAAGSPQRVSIEREPGSRLVTLRGSVPLGQEMVSLPLAIEHPAEYGAALLKRLLEERNVRLNGRAVARHVSDPDPTPTTVLAEHVSLPLGDSLRLLNKVSQNLHAEMFLRAAARAKTGIGSTENGREAAREFFRSIGIKEEDVSFYDGSGLSRLNLVTAQAAVRLLQWVSKQTWADVYIDSLPVAALDGTLESRMRKTSAAGRVRAKTGSLTNVNALSGFADTLSGKHLVFSMFGNLHNLRGSEATAALDAICVAMVEEIGKPQQQPANRKRK